MKYFILLLMCVLADIDLTRNISAADNKLENIDSARHLTSSMSEDPGKDLYPQIRKLSDDFYVARIPDNQLSLVMERVDNRNFKSWIQYARLQSNPRIVMKAQNKQPSFTSEGASYFYKSLINYFPLKPLEVWVAYITKEENPEKIPDSMSNYNVETLSKGNGFSEKIQMFVTIVTTPQALITSHIGVSASIEGILYGRVRGVSMDLHSFAAKVMLMRNPERRFMINSPVDAMENIFVRSISSPGSLFIGTREMKQIMEERKMIPQEIFENEGRERIVQDVIKKAEEEKEEWNRRLANALGSGYADPDKEDVVIEDIKSQLRRDNLIAMGPEKQFIIAQEKVEKEIDLQMKLKEDYSMFLNPFTFGDDPIKSTDELLALMEKHPPLLSVDGVNGRTIENRLAIFNPQEPSQPWLIITEDDHSSYTTYRWMFSEPFKNDQDRTHYIAVDLKALADNKAVEAIKD